MSFPVSGISGINITDAIRPIAGVGQSSSSGFQDALNSAIQKVESTGNEASASVERFLGGEGEELHTTVLATQRAEMSFDMFQQVRNKMVGAYQEIMKMQI
ncbi:MAG TPA: flagellar hook-basal body complex protein FliE [Bryobacteraceae bacterium]|jgi:flagellar hook-basal body complex protein FliE|nr:flagellar hook-basal body complex protein FliE [Bryobacteraceae bacterium]